MTSVVVAALFSLYFEFSDRSSSTRVNAASRWLRLRLLRAEWSQSVSTQFKRIFRTVLKHVGSIGSADQCDCSAVWCRAASV